MIGNFEYIRRLDEVNLKKLDGNQKIPLLGAGLRIAYRLIRQGDNMLVIVIGAREDEEVYEDAQKRITRYNPYAHIRE